LTADTHWEELVVGKGRDELESCLPVFLQQRRWFAPKGEIKSARVAELVPLPRDSEKHFLALVTADYAQADPEEYLLPLAFASSTEAERLERESPSFVFSRARLEHPALDGIIYDATAGKEFGRMLFEIITRRRTLQCEQTEASLVGSTARIAHPTPRRTGTFGRKNRAAKYNHYL